LTQVGHIKGKPGYLAPEQLTDEPIDGRADLFAVGITLHECLTGQPLFSHGRDARETDEVLEAPLRPPSQSRPDVPKELDAVVMKLLERKRDHRFVSARAAAAALSSLPASFAPSSEGRKQLAYAVQESIVAHKRASGEVSAEPSVTMPGTA
jgi:serine/threonine-protein kinase